MDRRISCAAMVMGSVLALNASVLAADPKAGTGAQREGGSGEQSQFAWLGDWNLVLGAGGSYAFAADLDDGGEVSVARVGGDISFSGKVADDFRLTLSLDGEVSSYDFSDASGLIPGVTDEPWDTLYATGIALTGFYSIDKAWSVFGGGFARLGFEDGADLSESVYGGGVLGVGYKFTEDFAIRVGVGVSTQLEDDVRVFPALGLDWQISKMFSLRTDGLGLRFTAELSKEFSVYAAAKYEYRQYRLDEDRNDLPSGVARDEVVPLTVGMVWTPVKNFTISLEGGVVVYQEYETLSNQGVKRGSENTDPAGFVGGRIEFKF